ncbi:MAG: response regulator [Alishewanella aestuarii]
MDPDFLALRRVLLVDDCAPVRASIKGMLQQIGFKLIYQAKDAIEAISICEQHALDFILCDFNLGDCQDGYQLFETLKKPPIIAQHVLLRDYQRRKSAPNRAWGYRTATG